jgi:hypothetical protein
VYKGALYLTAELYLYSPYGPYGLYRASVPVQRALYLTADLYLYSPYGPYGLYRASMPVQGCTSPLLLFVKWPIGKAVLTNDGDSPNVYLITYSSNEFGQHNPTVSINQSVNTSPDHKVTKPEP